MTPAIQTPAAELAELAAWLDDLAAALTSNATTGRTASELRRWMKAQAARCAGRALLARTMLIHADQPSRKLAGASCEHCPAGGGGCGVCSPSTKPQETQQ